MLPSVVKNKVTKEILNDALVVEKDADNDASEHLMIIDHKSTPISTYDPVRKVVVRKAGTVRKISRIHA